jgi:uncharacterized membrane protein YbhN (UPF0104 family)
MKRPALRALALAVLAVGAWWVLRGVSLAGISHPLASARLGLLAAWGLPLLAATTVLRTMRYAALLPGPRRASSLYGVWTGIVLGTAANNVLPLRAGDFLRARQTVSAGYPLGAAALALASEKVIEAATGVTWAAPAVLALGSRRGLLLVVALVAAVGGPSVVWMARRQKLGARQLIEALAWSFVADFVELATIAACLAALHLPVQPLACMAVFGGVNLAIALPTTPGNLGAFEAGAAMPLVALGFDRDAAIAFACLYRVVQWFPVTALGAALWARGLAAGASRGAEVA